MIHKWDPKGDANRMKKLQINKMSIKRKET